MTRTFGLLACAIASARALQSPMSGRWPQQRRSPGVDAVSSSQLSIDWTARELWALEDSVPQYTVAVGEGSGAHIILWRRMQLDVSELCGRSISELRGRWAAERGAAAAAVAAVDSPPCLERWERLPDGSYRGELTSARAARRTLPASAPAAPHRRFSSPPVPAIRPLGRRDARRACGDGGDGPGRRARLQGRGGGLVRPLQGGRPLRARSAASPASRPRPCPPSTRPRCPARPAPPPTRPAAPRPPGAQRVEAEPAVAAADGAEQQLAPFSAALGAAPTPEAVAQLATPALALVALAAAVNVGMSAFGHHVDVSVFIV